MGWLTKDKRKTKSRVDPYCHYWSSAKWLLRVGSVLYFTMPKGVLKWRLLFLFSIFLFPLVASTSIGKSGKVTMYQYSNPFWHKESLIKSQLYNLKTSLLIHSKYQRYLNMARWSLWALFSILSDFSLRKHLESPISLRNHWLISWNILGSFACFAWITWIQQMRYFIVKVICYERTKSKSFFVIKIKTMSKTSSPKVGDQDI